MPVVTRATKGSALSHAEMDGNWAELLALIETKLGIDLATAITATKALPVGADSIFVADSAASGEIKEVLLSSLGPVARDVLAALTGENRLDAAAIKNLPSGGGAALGLWDRWYDWAAGNNNGASNDVFTQAAIAGGTATISTPAGTALGYNPGGVLLSSVATANSGYRYILPNQGALYFGVLGQKFRSQLLLRTIDSNALSRTGFLDNSDQNDAVDGAYFEISGSTISCKTANNSARTTAATTHTASVDVPYTLDVDAAEDGLSVRYRVYAGTSTTPVLDETITTNIPITAARGFGAGIVTTFATATATPLLMLYRLGIGTIDSFTRNYG